ncbi:RHS repeat-associated core domain-containing protein, partial [Candidatus Bathyarchaeota archaeon]|nr:RHS repeat-associated core domain-containing protein [Candidatus Bathyarchaeota archaeon]
MGHDPWYERSKSGTTQTTTDYIYVNGGLKAKIVAGGSSPGTYFYITDALGSVRQVWKQGATGAAFSVATYKPFGTPVSASGTEKVGYAGELIDSAAGTSPGLYYIGARWMDPELGRFVSMDSDLGRLSAPQTQNRYVYCVNNPLKFVDPTGGRSYSVNDNFWSIMPGWLAPLEVLEEMLTRIFTRDVFIAIGGLRAMQRIAAKTYRVVLDRAACIFIRSCAIGHELVNSVVPRAIETGKQVVKTISHRIIEEATSILERTILVASRLE